MLTADVLFGVSAFALIGCYTSGSFILLVIAFVLIGLSYGCIPPTSSAYVAYFFGRENYGTNFAIVNLNLLISSYLGPLCGGGDYMRTFYFIIGFTVIGFVLTLAIKKPAGREG